MMYKLLLAILASGQSMNRLLTTQVYTIGNEEI
jgi:hypothetical protein